MFFINLNTCITLLTLTLFTARPLKIAKYVAFVKDHVTIRMPIHHYFYHSSQKKSKKKEAAKAGNEETVLVQNVL